MSREYQKSVAKVQNRVVKLRKPPEEIPVLGFFIIRVVRGWKTAYNEDIRSWVTPSEGTKYPSYEIAYRTMQKFANSTLDEYRVYTLQELKNELW